jgi:GT2 family glycosyltransferase
VKIYVLIPVHNRGEMTQQCVIDLLSQEFDDELEIIVIDDGSTDETEQRVLDVQNSFKNLRNREITLIRGTGDWWWTKCVEVALEYVRPLLNVSDSVLLLNDDVRLEPDYLEELLKARKIEPECIVMSQLVNAENISDQIVSPVSVNSKNLQISAMEKLDFVDLRFVRSDVAPGRGTLYPASPLMEGHTVNTKKLPHYIADYEFSARISRLGYPILCALDASVFTEIDWGNARDNGNIMRRLFAKESSDNFGAHWAFWRTWSPDLSSGSLLLKMFRYKVVPSILKINGQETTR